MKNSINFSTWFDIHDPDHLRAYGYLSKYGKWPDKFLPNGIEFDINWQVKIVFKMAHAWISDRLK